MQICEDVRRAMKMAGMAHNAMKCAPNATPMRARTRDGEAAEGQRGAGHREAVDGGEVQNIDEAGGLV